MQKPEIADRRSLEEVAMLSLEFGRYLMECGGSARRVEEIVEMVARGLGSEREDLRIGYASLAITVGIGSEGITRMRKVGPLGVNQRFAQSLRDLAGAVQQGECTVAEVRATLNRLASAPRYPGWLVDIAVGVACASFGRLLGVDWAALGPVLLAATFGQWLRRRLAARAVNTFIAATFVGFVASAVSGLGASVLESFTVETAMVASILLLVPGVPSLNAQNDILEGHPTLGSARAVSVTVTLVFLTVGVWLSQTLIGKWGVAAADHSLGTPSGEGVSHLLHQSVFGGISAIGFGVLFNIGGRALLWCGAVGALALAIRCVGLELGWTLEGASFAAALAVGSGVQLFQERVSISRTALAAAGCIPMIPGGLAAKAILGLFALTASSVQDADRTFINSAQDALRVLFTMGAMGTGLAIPSMLLRR